MRTTAAVLALLWLGCLFGPRTPSTDEQRLSIQLTNQTPHPICHVWQSVMIWDGHVGQYAAAQPAVVPVIDAKSPKDCVGPNGTRTVKIYGGFSEFTAFEDPGAPKPAPSAGTFDWTPAAGAFVFADPSTLDEPKLRDRSTVITIEGRARRLAETGRDNLLRTYDLVLGAMHVIETVPSDSKDLRKAIEVAAKAKELVAAGLSTFDTLGRGGPPFTTKDGKTFDVPHFRAAFESFRDALAKADGALHDKLAAAYAQEYGARGDEIADLMQYGPPTLVEASKPGGRDHRKPDKACWRWDDYYEHWRRCYGSDGKRSSQEVSHPHQRPQAASPAPAGSAPAEAGPSESAGGACMPKSCTEVHAECGQHPNGCGGTIDCGGCAPENVCKEYTPGDGFKCWNR